MRHLRGKMTYSNVVATIALFLAVGGATAFAAGKLAKNSVGTKQLKANAVTTAKIKNGAVTGAKIKNGTITGGKINLASLGTVPSAASAGSAASATEATAVDGLHMAKFSFAPSASDVGPTAVFSGAGLTLYAACVAKTVRFGATTSVAGSEIYASGNYESTYAGTEDQNFQPGGEVPIGKYIGDGSEDEIQGQIVYSNPNGGVVTAQFTLNSLAPRNSSCNVEGIAEYS